MTTTRVAQGPRRGLTWPELVALGTGACAAAAGIAALLGLVDAPFGTALRTLAEIGFITALIWWAAARVRTHERALRESEVEVRRNAAQLGGLLETLPVHVEDPPMVEAAQAAAFDAPVAQISAAMRTMLAKQPEPALLIAKQHEIFVHDLERKRGAVFGQIAQHCDRLPILAQKLAPRGLRAGPRQRLIVLFGQHRQFLRAGLQFRKSLPARAFVVYEAQVS